MASVEPAGEADSEANAVLTLDGGGCVVVGSILTSDRGNDVYLAELEPAGSVVWEGSYGGDSLDIGRDVIRTIDGGYSVVGSTRSFGIHVEQYHLKVSGSGAFEWQHNWGQVNDQEGFEHIQLADGRFASNGYVSQGGAGGKDMFLLITDESGGFILGQTQGGPENEFGRSLIRMDGGYLMCGITFSYGAGSSDVFLVRTNEVGFTISDEVSSNFDPISVVEIDAPLAFSSIYPNPTSGSFTIRTGVQLTLVRVHDALGRSVMETAPANSQNEFVVDLPSGQYTVLWTDRNGLSARAPLLID
jgi:hypothetical protein